MPGIESRSAMCWESHISVGAQQLLLGSIFPSGGLLRELYGMQEIELGSVIWKAGTLLTSISLASSILWF